MKSTLSLLALFAASYVAAGPIPNNGNALLIKRTQAAAEPPAAVNATAPEPAPAPAPAPAANPEEQKAADDKAGMSGCMPC